MFDRKIFFDESNGCLFLIHQCLYGWIQACMHAWQAGRNLVITHIVIYDNSLFIIEIETEKLFDNGV